MALQFNETNTNLKIYENLSADDYAELTKEEHALYLVKNVGVYKGTKLIARNEDITKLGLEKVLNLYRNESVAEITNLTDTMIQFNDTINMPIGDWDINFNSINNYNDEGYWVGMRIVQNYFSGQMDIKYNYISSETEDSTTISSTTVYQNGQWVDRAYQNIAITGGWDVQNSELIEILMSNSSSISIPQNNKYQLDVYEVSSLDEFHLIRKDPNAFYLVANNGVYKGSVLIASSISEDHILSLLDTTINNKIQVSINDDETIDLIIN